LESLIEDLKVLTSTHEPGFEEKVRARLAAYVASGDAEWQAYKFTNPYKYARNLLEINKEFEMIVLCWEAGQESPIHNHSSQHCWYAVLEGGVEEIYYYFDEKTKTISQGEKHIHNHGDVGHIADEVALHMVRPFSGKTACTLHVYSKPIPMCNIYNPLTAEVTSRVSGFYTVFGKKYAPGDSSIYRQLYKELQGEWSDSYCKLYAMCNAEGVPSCPSARVSDSASCSATNEPAFKSVTASYS